MKRFALLLALLLVVFPLVGFAQYQPPTSSPLPDDVNQSITNGINLLGDVQSGVDDLTSNFAPAMSTLGYVLLAIFAAWQILAWAQEQGIRFVDNVFHRVQLAQFVVILFRIFVASMMLFYFSRPILFGRVSFHQLFPYAAQQIANVINQTFMKEVMQNIAWCFQYTQIPGSFAPMMTIVYLIVLLGWSLATFAMTFVTAISYIGVGIFTFFGQIMIPFYVTKSNQGRFWGWLDMMIGFSMYRAVGAAYNYVMAHCYLDFFNHTVAGDYSLGNWLATFPAFFWLTPAFIFGMGFVPWITHKLFGGTAEMGQSWSNQLQGMIFSSIAKK